MKMKRGWFLMLFVVMALPAALMAQGEGARNATWKIADGKIIISYDLVVPEGSDYEVAVVLRRESDPSFMITPVSVTGDAGKNTRPGTRKIAVWDFRKDVQSPLAGNDYFFEFRITLQERSSASWLWYAGGGAVVAGAAAVLILGKTADNGTAPGASTLPDAPRVRPTN